MVFFQKKILVIVSQVLLLIADFANLFLSDILMYEVSNGVSFDFAAMLHNKFFWILLIVKVAHILLVITISAINNKNDEKIEAAIAKQQIALLSQMTAESENGNYERANKVLKLFDKLAKRRNK